jgi:hypothetical protein
MIERVLAAMAAAALIATLPACGGAGTPGAPSIAPNAAAAGRGVPLQQSVLVTATYKGKPINKQLVILSRNRRGGPKIAQGRTGLKGRVRLNGSWTRTEKICVWGTYVHGSGSSQATVCQTPFPSQITLNFL